MIPENLFYRFWPITVIYQNMFKSIKITFTIGMEAHLLASIPYPKSCEYPKQLESDKCIPGNIVMGTVPNDHRHISTTLWYL